MSVKNPPLPPTGTTSGTYAAGDDSRFAQITTNTNAIATNTTNIASNTSNITTNTTNITSLTTTTTSNTTAITTATTGLAKLTLTPTATKTSAYTAIAQDFVLADASGGAFTITLPTTPADGAEVAIKKIDSSTGVVTVVPGGSAAFTSGGASVLLSLAGHAVTWRYQTSTTKWIAIANDLPLAATDTRYMVQGGTLAPVYVYSSYAAAPALPANSVVISISGA